MPYKSRRGRKRGRKRKEEVKPQPEQIPVHTHAKRGRKRGRKRKTEAKLPAMAHASTSTARARASAIVPARARPPTPGPVRSRPPTPGPVRSRPPTPGPVRVRARHPAPGPVRIRARPPTPGPIRPRPRAARPATPAPTLDNAPSPIPAPALAPTAAPVPTLAPAPALAPTAAPVPTLAPAPALAPTAAPVPTVAPAPALAPTAAPVPTVAPAPALAPIPAPAPVPAPASVPVPAPVPSTSDDYEYKYSRILPYLTNAGNHDENMFSRAYVKPTASLSECLFAEEDKSDDFEIEVSEPESVDIRCSENASSDFLSLNTTTSFEESINNCVRPLADREEASGGKEEASREEDSEEKPGEGTSKIVASSLLVKNDSPWRMPRSESLVVRPGSPSLPMSEHEEAARMKELERKITEGEEVSVAEIRLYRRLKLRRVDREKNVQVFDPHVNYQSFWAMIETNTRMSLDRYLYDRYHFCQHDYLNSYRTRLQGSKELLYSSLSPYTKRILKPFILRDHETTPLWLRMMDEMLAKANKKNPNWVPSPKASIDYCYVRPHHLPAMNSLAEIYFWPGINLAECLRCPDFSCVVFYKKLLIGFTVASPDLFRNEVYISYMVVRREWQCSGIASVMLYHVIETCKGRDLTLHVSPTNPALILYQKFGFKVICFEKNFYARYLPPDSNQCRHAFYMRSEDLPKK